MPRPSAPALAGGGYLHLDLRPVTPPTLHTATNHTYTPSHLQIDVEGFDPSVVAGALGSIRARKISIVAFEYTEIGVWPQWTLEVVSNLLAAHDFVCYMTGGFPSCCCCCCCCTAAECRRGMLGMLWRVPLDLNTPRRTALRPCRQEDRAWLPVPADRLLGSQL